MTSTEIAAADKIMLGATEAEAMYIGSTLIWQKVVEAPYDMELEYLESTGTQYINTGIINNSSVIIDMKMSASGTNCLHGSEYTYQYRFKWGADGNGRIYYGYQNNHTSGVTFQLNQPCTYHLKQGEQYVKDYQGNTILSSSETLSTYSTNPIMLFKCYSGSDWVNTSGTTRIYSCKIYNNGVLMDLIPVRIGQIGYLYDKVSGQLFGNSGTGNFILGPDIIQPDIIQVEYLESTGTQYINTNYEVWNYGLSGEIKMQRTGDSTGEKAYIGRTSASGFDLYTKSNCGIALWIDGGNVSIDIISGSQYFDKNIHIVQFEIVQNGTSYISIDGDTYSQTNSLGTRTKYPIQLFSHRGYYNSEGRIYYCKLYDEGTLVLDLIPVRIGQVGYMYDKVSGQLYGNAGTGSFTLGPDKLINN